MFCFVTTSLSSACVVGLQLLFAFHLMAPFISGSADSTRSRKSWRSIIWPKVFVALVVRIFCEEIRIFIMFPCNLFCCRSNHFKYLLHSLSIYIYCFFLIVSFIFLSLLCPFELSLLIIYSFVSFNFFFSIWFSLLLSLSLSFFLSFFLSFLIFLSFFFFFICNLQFSFFFLCVFI